MKPMTNYVVAIILREEWRFFLFSAACLPDRTEFLKLQAFAFTSAERYQNRYPLAAIISYPQLVVVLNGAGTRPRTNYGKTISE